MILMTPEKRFLRVLIAAPGDCSKLRLKMAAAMNSWNVTWFDRTGIYLWAWMWETCSYPNSGLGGQKELNSQLVAKADMTVAFFRHKLGGSPTGASSGTVEEIDESIKKDIPVGILFHDDPDDLPNPVEAARIDDFKRSIQSGPHYTMSFEDTTDAVDLALKFIAERALSMKEEEEAAMEVAATKASPTESDKAAPKSHFEQGGRGASKRGSSGYEIPLPDVKVDAEVLRRAQQDAVDSISPESMRGIESAKERAIRQMVQLRHAIKDPAVDLANVGGEEWTRVAREIMRRNHSTTEIAAHDWDFSVNKNETGWELSNRSGEGISLLAYEVLEPYPESRIPRTVVKHDSPTAILDGESIMIDGLEATLDELKASYIKLTYRIGGTNYVRTAIVENSSVFKE